MKISSPPQTFTNLRDIIAHWAKIAPQAPALVLDGNSLDYAELLRRSDALARALVAAGISPGDRVAVLSTPHPDYVVTLIATAAIGAIWVGLNPRYRYEELLQIVQDCKPKILVTRTKIGERDYAHDLAALADKCESIEKIVIGAGDSIIFGSVPIAEFVDAGAAIPNGSLAERFSASGSRMACMIVYTSGSTGQPKGALLHHAGIIAFSLEQTRLWPVSPLRVVNYFPINHIGCVIDVTMPCLAQGGTVYFLEQFDPIECLTIMQSQRITAWMSVPTVFHMMLAEPEFKSFDLSALQLIVWEGAAIPEAVATELRSIVPRLATNYGMTETGSAITILEPTDDLEIAVNSVGSPFPGVEIRLVRDDGMDVDDGETGEVLARSCYNMLGYWGREDANATAFTNDGYFRTGDLAVRRADGRYSIVGRLQDMFKSGGYNVYPREIEIVLESHPAVSGAAVIALPDSVWGESGIAFVTVNTDTDDEDLIAWCRSRLANFKVPKRVIIEEDLPKLPIGKIDKPALVRRAAHKFNECSAEK